MKTNKFMAAALFVGALAMVACNPEEKTPVVIPPTPPTEDVPEIAKPEDGYVTVVINIPEGTECNGIAFKGTYDESEWSGADTYLGVGTAQAPVADAILFEPIEGYKGWFQATYQMGEAGLQGKICLIYTNDKNWEGQAINWEIDDANTSVGYEMTEGNIKITGNNGVLYVKIGGWQSSECVAVVDYHITVLAPAFCGEEFAIELVGSFEGWGSAPVALVADGEGKFTATIQASANAALKVRGVGGWDKEIQGLDSQTGEWNGVADFVLTENTDVIMDYSDAAVYRWNVCAE